MRLGRVVRKLKRRDTGWQLDERHERYRAVILATPPGNAARLLETTEGGDDARSALARFEYAPIRTTYLHYPCPVRLPQPMLGLSGRRTQWLFDLAQLGRPAGWIAAVESAASVDALEPSADVVKAVHEDVTHVLDDIPQPQFTRVILERRATYCCTPGLARPDIRVGVHGLYLAGDYVDCEYPATLEAAVRTGVRAAEAALDEL